MLTFGIIIPAHNAEQTLRIPMEFIRGIKANGVFRFYVVLVDDCSSDATQQLAHEYLAEGLVDRYVRHSHNRGVSAARNSGIEACGATDYLIFLDADDAFHADLVQGLASVQGQDMVIFNHVIAEGDKQRVTAHEAPEGMLSSETLEVYLAKYLERPNRHHMWTSSWAKVFRTATIVDAGLRFKTNMSLFEDVDFNFRFLKYAAQISYNTHCAYIHHVPVGVVLLRKGTFGSNGEIKKMFAFVEALMSLRGYLRGRPKSTLLNARLHHAIGAYTVITSIRIALRVQTMRDFFTIKQQWKTQLQRPIVRRSWKYYDAQSAGGDMWIPRLLTWGCYGAAFLACLRKAKIRYKG